MIMSVEFYENCKSAFLQDFVKEMRKYWQDIIRDSEKDRISFNLWFRSTFPEIPIVDLWWAGCIF